MMVFGFSQVNLDFYGMNGKIVEDGNKLIQITDNPFLLKFGTGFLNDSSNLDDEINLYQLRLPNW